VWSKAGRFVEGLHAVGGLLNQNISTNSMFIVCCVSSIQVIMLLELPCIYCMYVLMLLPHE
jgi:hypothetical protein